MILVLGVAFVAYIFGVSYGGTSTSWKEFLTHPGVITALVAVFYLLVLLEARWLLVARPYMISLDADIESVRIRSRAAAKAVGANQFYAVPLEPLDELLDAAECHLECQDALLWSWGDQKAAMQLIGQADEMLAGGLTPMEARIRLDFVTAQLDRFASLDPAAATATLRIRAEAANIERRLHPTWADYVESGSAPVGAPDGDGEVASDGNEPNRSADLAQSFRALHSNALQLLHRLEVDEFARILKWHRKVLWLTAAGLVLAVLLAATLGSAELLLVGAAGAYFARLTRIIRRADAQPEDASSYWTNLLLGPLLGALAAYGGILLVEFLKVLDVLGPALEDVSFAPADEASRVLTYGLAFLLGFSEGLVNKMADVGSARLTRSDPSDLSAATSRTGTAISRN